MDRQKILDRHIAAGNQLAIARHALHALLATIELMANEDEALKNIATVAADDLEILNEFLVRQCYLDFPDSDEIAINALYHSAPPYTKLIFPDTRPKENHIYTWHSPDFKRAVVACYLLATTAPIAPSQLMPVGVALNSQDADEYLTDSTIVLRHPLQTKQELLVTLTQLLP
jgi:hypothetical protein